MWRKARRAAENCFSSRQWYVKVLYFLVYLQPSLKQTVSLHLSWQDSRLQYMAIISASGRVNGLPGSSRQSERWTCDSCPCSFVEFSKRSPGFLVFFWCDQHGTELKACCFISRARIREIICLKKGRGGAGGSIHISLNSGESESGLL